MIDYIAINGLISGYKKEFTLKEITTKIQKGSITGIVGPNGSGKTTLFKSLTNEIPLIKGEILFEGIGIQKIPTKEKAKKIAVVAQHNDHTDMTVEEYVLLGRTPYKKTFQFFDTAEDIAIAHRYMKLTDVYQYKDKPMYALSGGEQQLAAIAKALTQEPEVLLLDEPTSALDISHQVQILNLLQHLNETLHITILLIIHDLNLAGEYCHYLHLMHQGNIYCEGTPEEVLKYDIIEAVYNTVVITHTNPLSQKPVIFLVSEKILKNYRK